MKVLELIEKLSSLDPELVVYTDDYWREKPVRHITVEQLNHVKEKAVLIA